MRLCGADLPEPPEAFSPAETKLYLEEGVFGQAGRCCVSVGILGIKYSPIGSCGHFWACFKSPKTYLILVKVRLEG